MKLRYIIPVIAAAGLSLSSCNDWLQEDTPGTQKFNDFFINGAVAVQTVNACYAPAAWEYNPGAYFSEWYIGDIASDDALKGGQDKADDSNAYDIDNFKVTINNNILLNYYRAKYQGVARCNLALREVAKIEPDKYMSQSRKNCLLGEAHFMRAYYYFQLVKVFGGVPLIDHVIETSTQWQQPRATAEQVYDHIIADLTAADSLLWNRSQYAAADLGRATRGAAQAYLCKAYLYAGKPDKAYEWGKKWATEQYGKEYQLLSLFDENFTLMGENSQESIFELQYMADPTSDYGEGFGFTRGTFTTILTRPRVSSLGSKRGWGFNHPTQNLFDEFEDGDPRRDLTIGQLSATESQEVEANYLGNSYYNLKTSMAEQGTFPSLDHDSRGPKNYIMMRAADALLLYAEAALESGRDKAAAKWALEQVRARARQMVNHVCLPQFPNYGYADTDEGLRQAIRHERRVELAMEGHRWYDIVRWGIAAKLMDKDNGSYASRESAEARAEMAKFIPCKHELFPLPAEELNLNPMQQNPGY